MKKIIYFLFLPILLQGQIQITVSPIIGYSRLTHGIDFRTTEMYNVYQFVAISHRPAEYNWEDFEEDYVLKNYVNMPRFGISTNLYVLNIIQLTGEITSSSSSYTVLSYSVAASMGKHLKISEDGWTLPFYLGYRLIHDQGFGAHTLVNSIGNEEGKMNAQTFFSPKKPLGDPNGKLFYVKGGLSHSMGRFRLNVYLQQEFDLTDHLQRSARMNTFGIYASAEYFLKK